MLLQIPIEGGHKGGAIRLVYRERTESISTETDESKRRFSLWAFHNACQQTLEPITAGAMALLVVRLVWTNAPIATVFSRPLDVPAFIEALANVKGVLNQLSWNPPSAADQNEESSDSDSSYRGCTSRGCHSDCLCKVPNDYDPYHENHKNEEGFFFFLKSDYDLTSQRLTFASLKEEDCHLALLFQACCPSIEVHLAVVERTYKERIQRRSDYCGYDENEPDLSVSNWFHPEIGPVHLSGMDDYPRGRLIDKEQSMYETPDEEFFKPDRKVAENGYTRSTYLTPALCIWPKKESIRMYSKYGFGALLDRMESAAGCDAGLKSARELVGSIALNQYKVWRDPDTNGADRARRTLRIIVKLGAREEGLRLLMLLGTDFRGPDGTTNFEGIRDEAVAEAIAKFECYVGGN